MYELPLYFLEQECRAQTRIIGENLKGIKISEADNVFGTPLTVDDIGLVKWFVDAFYVVHADCKGHTGAMMTFGKGAMTSFSQKQK